MVTRYVAMIDGEPGAYGVVFPDAPGCTAMGDSLDTALASAAGALREWIEICAAKGFAAPRARSLEMLRSDPEVIEALAEGAILSPASRRLSMPAVR